MLKHTKMHSFQDNAEISNNVKNKLRNKERTYSFDQDEKN